MKRPHDPLRLDVAAFTQAGDTLAGQWPGTALARLAESQAPPQDLPPAPVQWRVAGQMRPVAGAAAQPWLTLSASTEVWLCCQRCLQPYALPLQVHNAIRFVHGEADAEALDAEIDDDVLALTRSLNLQDLVEDELLLALPIVPRHDTCPVALPTRVGEADLAAGQAAADHPFAALQALAKPLSSCSNTCGSSFSAPM